MKLSLVFELLLIFILLAFAASKSVKKQHNHRKSIQNRNDDDKSEESGINKYCKCQEAFCNCCRDFAVEVVNLKGPGCATLMYLDGDKMSVSLSFGKKVITNRTLTNRKPSPVCMPLPGGISKFCGRVYNIARAGEEFRACLGLELQAKKTVEAAVRVSCFKFGPRGVTSEPADPLPLVPDSEKGDDDDEDDDDDDDELEDGFGIGIGDDDDDDDDDDGDDDDDDDDDDGGLELVKDADGVSDDYAGFPGLGDSFFDELFSSESSNKKKSNKNKKKQAPAPTSTTTTTKRPRPTRRPGRRPSTRTTTPRPTRSTTVRIRPVNRRPTRRPSRRPENGSRRRTTTEKVTTLVSSTTTTTTAPMAPVSVEIQTTERNQIENVINDQVLEIADHIQNQTPVIMGTTEKSVLNFDDPTLEMSLAHVTGQLSSLHVTPLLPNDVKESAMPPKEQEDMNYEKVEMITAKAPSISSFSVTTEESINDNLIQIVESLDSESEEVMPTKDTTATDESRGDFVNRGIRYQAIQLPKKRNRNQDFTLSDIDVLDLTQIGESIGDQIGVFGGGKKKNNPKKQHKVRDGKGDDNNYDDIFDTLSDTLIMRKSDSGNKGRKDRRRQNKMMRGEW